MKENNILSDKGLPSRVRRKSGKTYFTRIVSGDNSEHYKKDMKFGKRS